MNATLVLVNITGLIIGVSYGLHGPILPLFAKNLIGASYSELGLVGLANFIPYMFIPLFVGILLDRFNNGHLLTLGIMLNSASVYLLSISQSVPEIMGYRILTGVAHAFFWPPCESIISNQSTGKNRVKNISWFTMFFVIGFMVGPLFGTVFLEELDVSYRVLFQITAIVLASSIIASLLASKKRVKTDHAFSWVSLKEITQFPIVIILLVFCTSVFGIILTIYPAFLNDNDTSDTDVLYLYFLFGISRVVSLGLAGQFAKRTSHTLIASVAAITIGLALSATGGSLVVYAVSLVFMGFGVGISFPLTLEIVLSKTKKEISGKMIGAYEMVFGTGWAIGPTVAGPLTQSLGDQMPYLVFCMAGIAVTIITIAYRKNLEPLR